MSIGDFEIEQPFVRHYHCSDCQTEHYIGERCPWGNDGAIEEGDRINGVFDVCHWRKEDT